MNDNRIFIAILFITLAAMLLSGCAIGPRAEANIHVLSPHDNSITAGSHNTEVKSAGNSDKMMIPGAFFFIAIGTLAEGR